MLRVYVHTSRFVLICKIKSFETLSKNMIHYKIVITKWPKTFTRYFYAYTVSPFHSIYGDIVTPRTTTSRNCSLLRSRSRCLMRSIHVPMKTLRSIPLNGHIFPSSLSNGRKSYFKRILYNYYTVTKRLLTL